MTQPLRFMLLLSFLLLQACCGIAALRKETEEPTSHTNQDQYNTGVASINKVSDELIFVSVIITKEYQRLCAHGNEEEDEQDKAARLRKLKKQNKLAAQDYIQIAHPYAAFLHNQTLVFDFRVKHRSFSTGYFRYGLFKKLHILFLVFLI